MPKALIFKQGSAHLEPTLSSLRAIAGRAIAYQRGACLEIGLEAKERFEAVSRKDSWITIPRDGVVFFAPPAGWDFEPMPCRRCSMSLVCMQAGGPDNILSNPKMADFCPIITDIAAVRGTGEDHTGYLFKLPETEESVRRVGRWAHELDEHVKASFDVLNNVQLLGEPEDGEEHGAELYAKTGDHSHVSDLGSPFNFREHPDPRYYEWGAVETNRLVRSAQAKKNGEATRLVAKVRREECRNCVYSCKPLRSWSADRILHREELNKSHEVRSPTVLTRTRCSVRRSELEAIWDGSDNQVQAVAASLVAGHTFDKGRSTYIVMGQDWSESKVYADGFWNAPGGQVEVRNLRPPYPYADKMSILFDQDELGIDLDRLIEEVWSLGEYLPLTFWALRQLGKMFRSGETHFEVNGRSTRNDVLYMKLEVPGWREPTIEVGSDTRAHTWRGRNHKGNSIDVGSRPRFHTYYTYPYFDDIQKNLNRQPGGGL